ncbi:hypothetical protein CAEBREN_01991 [Caenorhabditis brenneri]|uniref:Uncharacterized protein n=1 Tax=Caenorhabditis brenneri TaxID=135651 RepID=G0N5A6_CAEBE|nr:hypothetical protein CAEBREN_01991 [Caenorhabditis brenneri]
MSKTYVYCKLDFLRQNSLVEFMDKTHAIRFDPIFLHVGPETRRNLEIVFNNQYCMKTVESWDIEFIITPPSLTQTRVHTLLAHPDTFTLSAAEEWFCLKKRRTQRFVSSFTDCVYA